jgi:hypothetical protein
MIQKYFKMQLIILRMMNMQLRRSASDTDLLLVLWTSFCAGKQYECKTYSD